jgi:tetratricopeptide (TPR) repeat protein
MGYWGVAMCQPGFGNADSRWINAINKAVSLKNDASALEQDLITASHTLITKGPDAAFQPFRSLAAKYPQQPDIVAFAAIMMRQSNNEMNGPVGNEIKTMLEKAMAATPTNMALMHYYVHLLELRPDFRQAIPIANKMAKLTPNSPHIQHMTGHLDYLAGNYDNAIAAYQTARREEEQYHKDEKIPFMANQNYIHNLHFLAVVQAETNNYKAALATATQLANLSIKTNIPNEGATLMLHYEGRILPALVHIRFREYQKAIEYFDQILNSLDNPVSNQLVKRYFEAMREYCKGMNSLLTPSSIPSEGETMATQFGMNFTKTLGEFEQIATQYQNSPEFKSINETYDILSMARYELAGWIDNIDATKPFNEVAWKEAIGLQNAIKYDEPPRLMYPIEESLARLHRYRKENALAQKAIVEALKRRPNSKVIAKI